MRVQQPIEMVATAAVANVAIVVQGLIYISRDETLVGPVSPNMTVIALPYNARADRTTLPWAPLVPWTEIVHEIVLLLALAHTIAGSASRPQVGAAILVAYSGLDRGCHG